MCFSVAIFWLTIDSSKLTQIQSYVLAFSSLLARRWILLLWKSLKAPSIFLWLGNVMFCLQMEKIRLSVKDNNLKFFHKWNYKLSTSDSLPTCWPYPFISLPFPFFKRGVLPQRWTLFHTRCDYCQHTTAHHSAPQLTTASAPQLTTAHHSSPQITTAHHSLAQAGAKPASVRAVLVAVTEENYFRRRGAQQNLETQRWA